MTSTMNTEITGQVTRMNAQPDTAGGIVMTCDIGTADGMTTATLRLDDGGTGYLRCAIEDATPTPAALAQGMGLDNRAFCTELIWIAADKPKWQQKAGWSLYFDNELIAHTAEHLTHQAAQTWADARLTALTTRMTWLSGDEPGTFYRVPCSAPRRWRWFWRTVAALMSRS
ncbi:hypothetical protein C8D87_114169 [Lentzea atacamensis]|uniref:Uncharacterized protein n=2 Tax=Lentzea atacamensis TaxID=531938 RepID=A0ABX9DWS8_9PSEU|nr:hypothetical protein C8D87_114169 [Lentzea atacamensis]